VIRDDSFVAVVVVVVKIVFVDGDLDAANDDGSFVVELVVNDGVVVVGIVDGKHVRLASSHRANAL